jgi:hypothetical protein
VGAPEHLPRAAPPVSRRSLRSARVPPMHYLDKLPRPSLGAGKQGGSELDRRTSPKWLRIQPALTARPGLPHRRAGQPMRPPVHVASARQHSGEPSSGLGPNGGRNDRLGGPDLAGLDSEIAGLVDRSTQELRRAWRTLHHTGPPLGLSRDLIIRGSPISCNSAPMAARAAHCSVAFGLWRESSRKALVPSISALC